MVYAILKYNKARGRLMKTRRRWGITLTYGFNLKTHGIRWICARKVHQTIGAKQTTFRRKTCSVKKKREKQNKKYSSWYQQTRRDKFLPTEGGPGVPLEKHIAWLWNSAPSWKNDVFCTVKWSSWLVLSVVIAFLLHGCCFIWPVHKGGIVM